MKELKFRVYSKEHSKAIQEVLFKLGYSWIGYQDIKYTYGSYLYVESDGCIMHGQEKDFFNTDLSKESTLDELYKMLNEERFELELNDSHTAVIKNDVVKVGCQEFTFDKIEELNKLIMKYKSKKH